MKLERLKFSDIKEVTRLTNGKVCKQWQKIVYSGFYGDLVTLPRMLRFVSWVNQYYGLTITYKVLKSNNN